MVESAGEVAGDEKFGAGAAAEVEKEAGDGEGEHDAGGEVGENVAAGEMLEEESISEIEGGKKKAGGDGFGA